MGRGLWLFDAAGNQTAEIAEYNSVITTERYREHSEWSGLFSPSDYAKFAAAYYAQMSGETEVYLVEKPVYTTGKKGGLEVSGRSASALLSLRTIVGTKAWNAMTAGAMLSNMMADFIGSRALALKFGTGTAVGSAFTLQRSWEDCGEIALEVLAAQNLGMRTRFDGTVPTLDVFAAADIGVNLGEKFLDGSTARLINDKSAWRNFAYVLGEGEGDARIQTTVDQTSGAERRELYVDARDLQREFTVAMPYTVNATNNMFTIVGHGLAVGNKVKLSGVTGGAPLANDTYYYVNVDGTTPMTADVFSLSATLGGATINVTTNGSGSITTLRINDAQYPTLLQARGASRLADTRRLEYAEASDVTAALRAGDVVWYDAGVFGSSFMASEVVSTYEGERVTRSVAMGDPPATGFRSLRRYL